jgi:hypothetical protein
MPQAENTEAPAGIDDLLHAKFLPKGDCHASARRRRRHHQREVARVVAAIQRDQFQRVDHVVVGDPDDAARRLVNAVMFSLPANRSVSARSVAAMSATTSPPQK